MPDLAPGAWTPFEFTLTPTAKDVFEGVTQGMTGGRYTALAFATQVVAGTNYAFLCEVEYASASPQDNAVVVRIHQPLSGRPHLMSIVPVRP